MKILVCFDGSLHSAAALEKALEIYASRNSEAELNENTTGDNETDSITILYVQPTKTSCTSKQKENGCELMCFTDRQFKIFAKKTLMPAVEVCKSFGGIRIRDGRPVIDESLLKKDTLLYEPKILLTSDKTIPEVICEEIKHMVYDLVILGKRGYHIGDEAQEDTGSTCAHVLKNVPTGCSVKVIKPPPPLRL